MSTGMQYTDQFQARFMLLTSYAKLISYITVNVLTYDTYNILNLISLV